MANNDGNLSNSTFFIHRQICTYLLTYMPYVTIAFMPLCTNLYIFFDKAPSFEARRPTGIWITGSASSGLLEHPLYFNIVPRQGIYFIKRFTFKNHWKNHSGSWASFFPLFIWRNWYKSVGRSHGWKWFSHFCSLILNLLSLVFCTFRTSKVRSKLEIRSWCSGCMFKKRAFRPLWWRSCIH